MKSFRLAPSVLVSAVLLLLSSCQLGPINYDRFEKRTIVENLAAIDSAAVIYDAQFSAGNIDAACTQAQAFLLAQPGVDTAVISPDSLVWAHFASGLLAGTGDVRRDTTGDSTGAVIRYQPTVRTATGGETGSPLHCVLPHGTELPGTRNEADAIRYAINVRYDWGDGETFTGSQVDIGLAAGLINPGTGVILWAGHGLLCDPGLTGVWAPGLVMGRTYNKEAMAQAAAQQFAGYFDPGPGLQRQVALVRFVGKSDFSAVVLPGFIRAHGSFNDRETLITNACKTIVYLSCCYSAYPGGGSPGPLTQAFLDAGADVVCGYSWAVGDMWASEKDKKFFLALSDDSFPMEAKRAMGDLTDPNPGRGGYHAEFGLWGDTLVLLQAGLIGHLGQGKWLSSYPGWTVQMFGSEATKLYGGIRDDDSAEAKAMVTILFPATSPGTFDLFTSGAYVQWSDFGSGHTYWAQAGYVGTSGTLTIDKCTDSLVVGTLEAKFGWWDATRNPYVDEPNDTFRFTSGRLRYSGKITHYGAFDPRRIWAELPARH